MIGLARSFSMTSQSSAERMTEKTIAPSSPSATEPVWSVRTTPAQAPVIISPSRPRFQMPARWASTPAIAT
jgi:hypothetical protein